MIVERSGEAGREGAAIGMDGHRSSRFPVASMSAYTQTAEFSKYSYLQRIEP